MQENYWTNELLRLQDLCNWKDSIAVEVLYSIIQDNKYAQKVFVLRNTPKVLKHLFNYPTISVLNIPVIDAKQRINTILCKFEKILPLMIKHEEHIELYKEYKEINLHTPVPELQQFDCRDVYMDNNSTTRIRPEVQKILIDYTRGDYGYGNPSTITSQGSIASNLIQSTRMTIASVIHASSSEIFFTGSGTESNNLAIKGIAFNHLQQKGHIITTMVEHPSVLETMKYLEGLGFRITYLQPDCYGNISATLVSETLQEDTILVSIMAANNEIGTLYPIREIGLLCKKYNIPLMVDGVQAFGKIPIDVIDMNITLFTFSGHKIYGPKGIGGIYIKNGTSLIPLLHGGGQENGIRSGTENVGHIITLGLATKLIVNEMEKESQKLQLLRDKLLKGLKKIDPTIVVYGPDENRLHGLLSVGFYKVNADFIIRELDHIGITISSGCACSAKKATPSHVLKAIGVINEDIAVIRFGLGQFSEEEDIEYVLKYFGDILLISKELY